MNPRIRRRWLVGLVSAAAVVASTSCSGSSSSDASSAGSTSPTSTTSASEGSSTPESTAPSSSEGKGDKSGKKSDDKTHQGSGDATKAPATSGSSPETTAPPTQVPRPQASPAPTQPASTPKPKVRDQSKVFETLPGSASTQCIDTAKSTTLRSDNIAMGDFTAAGKAFRQTKDHKEPLYFFVIPRHATRMTEATVTARAPGAKPKTFHSTSIATANKWLYYSMSIKVDSPGTWTFQVKSGRDNGCFTAKF